MEHNAMGMDPCDFQNDAIFNITTEKRTHVDTRTGLFEAHVPLPSVTGNSGYGPVIDMSLYYSPVVNNIAALGDGWSFAFTTWHEKNSDLTLHSGESIRVEKGKNLTTPAVMITWSDGNKELIVERKDGRTETLKKAGASQIWVPARLTTDGYRYLDLEWTPVEQKAAGLFAPGNAYQVRLASIKDPARTLLEVIYAEERTAYSQVLLHFWPGSAEALTFELRLADFSLRSVKTPEQTTAYFDYKDHPECGWLLTQMQTFEGLVEEVTYADAGLLFKNNPKLSMLPVVTNHTVTPASGTPLTSEYKYSVCDTSTAADKPPKGSAYQTEASNNHQRAIYFYQANNELVADLLAQGSHKRLRVFESDDRKASGTGEFSRSTSTQYDGVSREAGYSLVTERGLVLQLDNSSYTYFEYEDPAAGLSEEQLFRSNRLITEKSGVSNVRPHESSVRAYDTLQSALDKHVTKKDYATYCAKLGLPDPDSEQKNIGSPGALAAYMFIKDKVAVTDKSYSYTSVPGLNREKISFLRQAIAESDQDRVRVFPEAAAVGQRIEYYEDNDFRKGRQKSITRGNVALRGPLSDYGRPGIVGSQPSAPPFIASTGTSLSFAYEIDEPGATITTSTTETRGDASRTSTETRSILSGRLVSQTDTDANRTDYAYDACGRLASQTICAQSAEYKETTTYAYPASNRVEITEADGKARAQVSDGRDNTVREQIRGTSAAAWRDVLASTYDGLGRKSSSTRYDYLPDGVQVSETCTFGYDAWGNECTQSYGDSRVSTNQFDPTTRVRNEWTGSITDKQRKRTTYRGNDTVEKIEWLDAEGSSYQEDVYTYTSFGKVALVSVKGIHGSRSVGYTYDGFGRLIVERHEHDGYRHSFTYSYPKDWLIDEAVNVDVDERHNQYHNQQGTIGARSLDEWGRVTSLTRAGVTETYAYTGARMVPDSRTTADGKTLTYEYIKELGNKVSGIKDETGKQVKSFTYARGANGTSTASEGETAITFKHDANERVGSKRTRLTKLMDKTIDQTFSPAGRLLCETDARGVAATYQYDALGRRTAVVAGDVKTTHTYDKAGRLAKESIELGSESVAVNYSYDSLGREISRRFLKSAGLDLSIERVYYADNRLQSIELKDGTASIGKRSFLYNAAEQLAACETTGVCQPKNPKGKAISKQVFLYTGLGNITTTTSTFEGGESVSQRLYDYSEPYFETRTEAGGGTCCRLVSVTHSHADYKQSAKLEYDANGRVTKDAAGTTYSYDWLGRLKQVGSRYYSYDGMDTLATTGQGDGEHQIVYDGTQLRGEYRPDGSGRHLEAGSSACTVQRVKRSGVSRTMFELRDSDGTVLATFDATAKTTKPHAYSAYGEHSSDERDSLLGFKGEYRDGENDQYPLGRGYRSYDPAAMRFHAPDAWSPFGKGGQHPYGYCHGDPINVSDPTGHWGSIGSRSVNRGMRRIWGSRLPGPIKMGEHGALISTIIWSGLGVLTAIATGGTSLLLTAAIVAMAIIASATAIASVILQDSDPVASEILGWVSFGFTIGAGAFSLGLKAVAFAAKLGRTAMNVARNAYHRVGAAVARFRANGAGALLKSRASTYRPRSGADFRTAEEIGEALAPVRSGSVRVFTSIEEGYPAAFDFQPIPTGQQGSFMRLLDKVHESLNIGDINTVICSVTGVLGLTGAFESDDANFVNGNVNNATWLPWGSFNLGH